MVTNKFSEYVQYFRKLSQEHIQLKDFTHGTAADIMGKSRSDLDYPCLWLETPQMKLSDNDANQITGHRYGAIIVLWNAPDASEAELDEIWEKTEDIALDLLAKMRKDRRDHKFHINLNQVQLDPVSTLFIDSDYGWRVEFSLDKPINVCYNASKWNNQ